tara:strand:+ start:1324 stop:1806 length:483 start_codon:yes stop_codon:yes gene_type:complete
MMPSLIDVSLATASAMAGGADALLNSNKSLISKIAVSYEQYKQGAISKNQYDYIRKQTIDKLSENMKSTTRLFTGDKSVKEVLRISRTKGTVPTANIKYAASKIGDYGKAAGSVYQYMGEGNIADTTGITNVCRNIFEHASKTGIDTNKLLISNNLSSVL